MFEVNRVDALHVDSADFRRRALIRILLQVILKVVAPGERSVVVVVVVVGVVVV